MTMWTRTLNSHCFFFCLICFYLIWPTVSLTGCDFFTSKSTLSRSSENLAYSENLENKVIQVATHTLLKEDIELKAKEQGFKRGYQIKTPAVIKLLIRAFVGAEILAKYNRPVLQKTLEDEAARIEKETLRPQILKQIRSLFPTEQKYLELYVLPVYVNRVIYYGLFAMDPQFHKIPFEKVQNLILQVHQKQSLNETFSFKEMAESQGLKFNPSCVTQEGFFDENFLEQHLEEVPVEDVPPPRRFIQKQKRRQFTFTL